MSALRSLSRSILASLSNAWAFALLWYLMVIILLVFFTINIGPRIETGQTLFTAFWTSTTFSLLGVLFVIFVVFLPIIAIPIILSGFLSIGTYEQTGVRRRHLRYVFVVCIMSLVATIILSPIVLPYLMVRGWSEPLLYILAILNPASLFIGWLWEALRERYKYFRGETGMPDLPPLVNVNAKPLKGWQINLDIGAVAPRIGAVVDGLQRWSSFFESSAPTSETIWTFVRGSQDLDYKPIEALKKAGARYKAIRGLTESAWRGVDELRARLAVFLDVQPEQVVFMTSTTRAIEVAILASARTKNNETLHAPEVLFIPSLSRDVDIEHDALIGRLNFMHHHFSTRIKRIDISPELTDKNLDVSQRSASIADKLVSVVESDPAKFKTLLISHVTFSGGIVLPVHNLVG